jgi:hypothetical protein
MECPFGAGFMARFKIQWEMSSRSLLEQSEGRRSLWSPQDPEMQLAARNTCGDNPVPVFVQEMMALTSQAAESEERKWQRKQVQGKKRAANDHVQGQRINKKRHQNVHKVHAAV